MTALRWIGLPVSLLLIALPAQAGPLPWDAQEARGLLDGEPLPKPVPPRARELSTGLSDPVVRRLRPTADGRYLPARGALSGKSVYLSPGHGWVYETRWATQRDNVLGLVEDLSNADGINQFLLPYLLGAGAHVVGLRELDPQDQLVILDNGDGSLHPGRGTFYESGAAADVLGPGAAGFGQPQLPLAEGVDPFSLGSDLLLRARSTETVRATFVPAVPRSGRYFLYVSYTMAPDRARDALLTVTHPGGTSRYLVNQRRQGGSWVLIDRFYLEQGTDPLRCAISWSNASGQPGATISVDALRLGGGSGLVDRGGGRSGQRRSDECSRYHAQLAGAPQTVYNASQGSDRIDDVSCRARFTAWAHAPGEPAVYLSYHSNAFNGALRGTETYIYGPHPPDGSYRPAAAALQLGADRLARAIHEQLIGDLRAAYDPGWTDRTVKSAYFGELNPAYQDELPAALVELAFHDQPDDAAALKDPIFRQLAARALYKGIVRYFAEREGSAPRFLPEPPRALCARNAPGGQVEVRWLPPPAGGVLGDPALSYRVYRSRDGRAFDEGLATGEPALRFAPAGDDPLYLRVTALNAGGESLPGPTLAVRAAPTGRAQALLVAGFERLDASMTVLEEPPGLGQVARLFVEQMNSRSYLVEHGQALAPSRVSFDSCTPDGLALLPERALAGYQLLVWQGGKGLSDGRAIGAAHRGRLARAAASGSALILSGLQWGRSLSAGDAADRLFLEQVLRARFERAELGYALVAPLPKTPLSAVLPWRLASWQSGPYAVGVPEELAAEGGAELAASYSPGPAGAVVTFREPGVCRVLLGFPLEGVQPPERRTEIVSALLAYCRIEPDLPASDAGVALADGAQLADGGSAPADQGKAAASDGGASDVTTGSGLAADEDPGCGCALGEQPKAGALVLVLLIALARGRRRR